VGIWERERIVVIWIGFVRVELVWVGSMRVGWWGEGLGGALFGLVVVDNCRYRRIGVVRGGWRLGWILRFRSAERSGVGLLPSILSDVQLIPLGMDVEEASMFEQIVSWISYG